LTIKNSKSRNYT